MVPLALYAKSLLRLHAMSTGDKDRFELHPGRIRHIGSGGRAKTYLARISRALSGQNSRGRRSGQFTPSRAPGGGGGRRVIVKASITRMSVSSAAALTAHLCYIERDSAASEDERGRLFNSKTDDAETREFIEDLSGDRHYFRFIISPEDGNQMKTLKPLIRNLVSQMERDLGTPFQWVGAIHHDTGRPHAHLVVRGKRDDGTDLIIPRAYISRSIREHAEKLITLELGPETWLGQQGKLTAEISAERLTRIDHFLDRQRDHDSLLTLRDSPAKYRQLHASRLQTLERMGLADRLSGGRWRLNPDFKETLRALGNRGDIIKTMNRALVGHEGRRIDPDAIFDRGDGSGRSVTGAVLQKGLTGEGHDQTYVIIDGLDGRAVYANLGGSEQLTELKHGAIVTLVPPSVEPKPSDLTIDKIARANAGIYSAGLHQRYDPRANPEYIKAHVRRLEALRRKGHVPRTADAKWLVPSDFLTRVKDYEKFQARLNPVGLKIHSELGLSNQIKAIGLTWLDETPRSKSVPFGFGKDVAEARLKRCVFLSKIGIAADTGRPLTNKQKAELLRRDLSKAGHDLSKSLGKTYRAAPQSGEIEGIYQKSVSLVSGNFAVIERQHDFTLVRWRNVLERSPGKHVSGMMHRGRVSWTISRGRGLGA